SKAYVASHFGKTVTNSTPSAPDSAVPDDSRKSARTKSKNGTIRRTPSVTIKHGPDFEKFSVYFNLDNGAGKIRGVFMQGNESARPLFRKWLAPFRDDGAETLSVSNTFSTDHIPFNDIGLPAFQFIQDPIEYDTRTHHTNMDVLDHVQEDDLKQASIIMAAF